MTSRGGTPLASILLLLLGCSAPPASHHHRAAGLPASTTPPLFDDLGGYRRAITTRSPQAQAYFDQGLRLVYGFNHYEAQAAFREAARLDPECAMCAWGLALTYGSNYNSPTDAEREQGALAAVTRAQSLAVAGASGRRAEAEQELTALRAVQRGVPPERTIASFFTTADMLTLAAETLAGEIAVRTGDADAAVGHLAEAVRLQDRHWFTEPPPWYYPVRQSLGFALLHAGRAAEAAAVYREDMRRNPENGWSLFGLAQSLRAQGRSADAAAVEARFRLAWARADVTLTSSRL